MLRVLLGRSSLAEIGRFRLDACANGLRVSAYDQKRCQPQRQLVNLPNTISTQIELVEVAGSRDAKNPHTQDDFRCIFFSHKFIQNALD